MSKVKNVLCLVLALAMVFALAIPAFAADGDDEGIEPYGQRANCLRCGADSAFSKYTTTNHVTVSSCGTVPGQHAHLVTTYHYCYDCPNCGYWEDLHSTSLCLG